MWIPASVPSFRFVKFHRTTNVVVDVVFGIRNVLVEFMSEDWVVAEGEHSLENKPLN